MQLQLRFSGFAESYKTTLVGMERGRYLICSAPVLPGLWAVLNAPDQTTVRYLCEGVVYGFKCTLLTVLAKPFQLLVLSYPEKIETVNLRQHQRVPCLIPAKAKMGQTRVRRSPPRPEPERLLLCVGCADRRRGGHFTRG